MNGVLVDIGGWIIKIYLMVIIVTRRRLEDAKAVDKRLTSSRISLQRDVMLSVAVIERGKGWHVKAELNKIHYLI